jgi:acyl transferase domain-containing protein
MNSPSASQPVAVIGMSARMPGAADADQFWRLLRDGGDAVTELPSGRWPDEEVTEFRRGGFLDDVDRFDAGFFGLGPAEAAAMDPQQRLLLELSWHALEQSRIAPDAVQGSGAGVFIGVSGSDYAVLHDRLGGHGPGPYAVTGGHRSLIANRVSYTLGLRGPSLTLDTGQSSSLVAVQLACEQLSRGELPLALAGGVNLTTAAATPSTTAPTGSSAARAGRSSC